MASVVGMDAWGELRRQADATAGKRAMPPGRADILQYIDVAAPPVADRGVGDDDVDQAVVLALRTDVSGLVAEIDRHLQCGVPLEALFVSLLAPAARRLGDAWSADRIDFLDVTMGLWRLQEALREVAARTPRLTAMVDRPRVALFAPMPGDQHGFGAAMIEECFARAGWETDLLVGAERAELLAAIASCHCDLIGLTVTCDCPTDRLQSMIVAIRSVSRNPELVVLLGGRMFVADPSLATAAGADGTAATALEAVDLAERLVDAARATILR